MSEVIYNNVIRTDREEGVEKAIYESLDAVKNDKRWQELQHTESVSVKNRRHRADQVCLWLLCVLLLSAVIVLCVYFTIERNHLLTHNYNLTKEREKLHNDIKELNRWLSEKDQCSDNSGKWIYYNFSFYFISSDDKSWSNSREDCKQREADLMIINNKKEQEFMQNATHGFSPLWIGLSKKEGVWKWVDKSTLTTSFWIDTYPRSNNHYCARISSLGWSDFPCDHTFNWICEKRILKAYATATIA